MSLRASEIDIKPVESQVVERGSDSRAHVTEVPVSKIRPEDGLGRKRDRDGHQELQRSIAQFGVLTPITVRPAPDSSGDYLLIKGQGRTLACRLIGIELIPAIVVGRDYGDAKKVQQFLVENVARLKMRPVDRALLIQRARQEGEETAAIAARFGLATTTVRKLLAQMEGASRREVEALESGKVSLATHAIVARHTESIFRPPVLDIIVRYSLKSTELEALLVALGWRRLEKFGPNSAEERLALLEWACQTLESLPAGSIRSRLSQLANSFPESFIKSSQGCGVVTS